MQSYESSERMPARPAAVTKAIFLAGGEDTPLYPLTQVVARELLPVYDKPMIHYPISALMLAGIREMLVVSPLRQLRGFMELLGSGSRLGVSFSYAESPGGGAGADTFLTAESFIDDDPVALIYADAILLVAQASRLPLQSCDGATVLVVPGQVSPCHPIVGHDGDNKVINLMERPRNGQKGQIAAGIFVYDRQVLPIVKALLASGHEGPTILDINREYLRQGRLHARRLPRDVVRLDGSDPSELLEASNLVARFEERNACKVGCLEEAAFRMGYITAERLRRLICDLPEGDYREYLSRLAANAGKKWHPAFGGTRESWARCPCHVAHTVR